MPESIRKRAVREAVERGEVRALLTDLAAELIDKGDGCDGRTLTLVAWTIRKMDENEKMEANT